MSHAVSSVRQSCLHHAISSTTSISHVYVDPFRTLLQQCIIHGCQLQLWNNFPDLYMGLFLGVALGPSSLVIEAFGQHEPRRHPAT